MPLVYHRADESLACHRCNRRRPPPTRCPGCGGGRIRYLGLGTQRVEQELTTRFPAARVIRWDRDSTTQRGTYEALWRAFMNGEADVMVGTQMIAKALEFPRVTLVGVILADVGLFLPDFRAGERIVSTALADGRAGRSRRPLGGRAIVQTYVPEHYAIQAAAASRLRRLLRQRDGVPAGRTATRRSGGWSAWSTAPRSRSRCIAEASRVRGLLDAEIARQGIADIQVIGPAPCFAHRVRGRERWALLLRGDRFARAAGSA